MQRLIDTAGVDDFELWLLRSAASERPTAGAVAGMRAGLGISSGAAARVASISSLKLTLLAISVGAFLGLHGTEPSPKPLLQSATPSELVAVAQNSPPVFMEFREPDARSEPAIEQASSQKSPKVKATTAERSRASSGPDLREEIRLLDSARNAIKAQQAELALESLNVYAARFPSGAFKQEAAVLKIQAVALRGESGRASAMAKQFVESNPNSPYVGKASRIAKAPSSGTAPPSK